jgi:hypothetical protein
MKKDNVILANFDFLVDLDVAMFKFIKNRYKNSKYVDQKIINMEDENLIKYTMLNRKHINPLEVIMPEVDTTDMYYEIMNDHFDELLSYAKAYDTFGLLITFLNNASSVDIVVRCNNEKEEKFIKKLNPILNTTITPRSNVRVNDYSVIYEKYYAYLIEYPKLITKHIYIAAAKFNMEEDKDLLNVGLSTLFGDINAIHLMDLYQYVKFRFKKTEEDDDDDSI